MYIVYSSILISPLVAQLEQPIQSSHEPLDELFQRVRLLVTTPHFCIRNPLRDIASSVRSAAPASLITHLC